MPNALDYIDWRGDIPFSVSPFNEVDNLLICKLVSLDLTDIVPSEGERSIQEAAQGYFDKFGGNLGATGCVSWSFDQKGVLVIEREDLDEDTVMMDALDCGAADFEPEEECFTIYTDPDAFADVLSPMEEKGYTFLSAKVEMVPQNYVTLTEEKDVQNMEKLIDMMEDNDDIQNVYHNWDQD